MAATVLLFDLGDLRRKWGWFLALGIVMIVFGMIALAIMPAATIGTVLILGWLMIFSGIVEAVHGFQVRSWGGFFLHLIGGIVGVLIGLLVVTHPVAGAVTLLLGILLWADWPWSGFWFLGLSIGIALLLRGWSHVMLALALRSLPAAPSELRRVA